MKYAFDFIDVEIRPGKPRDTALTIVRDRMRGLRDQRNFLETYAPFVDFVKISNISPRFYAEEFLVEKLDLYKQFQVTPFFGGVLFENAMAQGKVDAFFDYLPDIGIPAIEISDNIIDLPRTDLLSAIRLGKSLGLTVFVEWGDKYATSPFDPDQAISDIRQSLSAGADRVVLERGEIDVILANSADADQTWRIAKLLEGIGRDRLVLEVETMDQIVSILHRFGGGLNLGPNIDFELVPWLEPARAGVGREVGHATIGAKAATRSSSD